MPPGAPWGITYPGWGIAYPLCSSRPLHRRRSRRRDERGDNSVCIRSVFIPSTGSRMMKRIKLNKREGESRSFLACSGSSAPLLFSINLRREEEPPVRSPTVHFHISRGRRTGLKRSGYPTANSSSSSLVRRRTNDKGERGRGGHRSTAQRTCSPSPTC